MLKGKITATVIIAAVILAAGWAYRVHSRQAIAHIDISDEQYPVRGIDISSHNGAVDFDSVVSAGILFVMIKASEGASFRDSLFEGNYQKARLAGLKTGAYHFFRFDCDGHTQAENLLSAIDGHPLDLPVAIDIEEWGNMDKVSTKQITDQLESMIGRLEENGRSVMIYTNKNGFNRFIRSRFDGYPLWICSFTDPPIDAKWDYWQFSHIGNVAGVQGMADLNTFNGSKDQWLQLPKEFSEANTINE